MERKIIKIVTLLVFIFLRIQASGQHLDYKTFRDSVTQLSCGQVDSLTVVNTRTKLETVKRGLNRNHSITTLSRSEIEIEEKKSLHMILGDATNKADLINSIQQADAIIVTLGTGRNMKATTLFSDFAKLIVEINREKKMDVPFIFVTGFGAGESKNYVPWIVKLFLKYLLKDVYADKTKMEEIITNSDLNWTVVRPGRLLDKELTEKYRIENTLFKGINIGGINRVDVADFLIKQAEKQTELKKYIALSEK